MTDKKPVFLLEYPQSKNQVFLALSMALYEFNFIFIDCSKITRL